MSEKPILFSAPMVRAILDGTKTQTRRVIKRHLDDRGLRFVTGWEDWHGCPIKCPYGNPGDHLWVRETWGVGCRPDPFDGWRDGIEYKADEAYLNKHDLLPLYSECVPDNVCLGDLNAGWRPSIHMPRWASRILLRVTDIRVERVQDITTCDIVAEGLNSQFREHDAAVDLRDQFRNLWNSINAKRGYSFESNPWCWCVSFERVTP